MIPWGIPCQMMVGNFINIFKTHINFIRNGMNNDKCKDIEYMFIFSTLENYIKMKIQNILIRNASCHEIYLAKFKSYVSVCFQYQSRIDISRLL